MAHDQESRDEDRTAGGRAGQLLATGENSPTCKASLTSPGDFSPVVKKRRGRPPKQAPALDLDAPPASPTDHVPEPSGPALPAAADAAPGVAQALDQLRDRQRADCQALAGEVARLRSLPDLGAGREGNQAAALGTLTRATAALHEMERAAYGLGQDAAQGRDKVFFFPVPIDNMADWATAARQVFGIDQRQDQANRQIGPGTGPRRATEE